MDERTRLNARRRGQAGAMANRKCPACERGNALGKRYAGYYPFQVFLGRKCRYCKAWTPTDFGDNVAKLRKEFDANDE